MDKMKLEWIQTEFYDLLDDALNKRIAAMKDAIENDSVTVVVLGEFNTGKSTFVNVLQGNQLEVSSTTTINAIPYEVSNVTLIDTPPIAELSQADCILQADIAIFIFDASSPLKRTEKNFIAEHLLEIESIIFIVNKIDYVDEEEEADVLLDVNNKLKKYFGLRKIQLHPLSATQAYGIFEIKRTLNNVIETFDRQARNKAKFKAIIRLITQLAKEQLEIFYTQIASLETEAAQIAATQKTIAAYSNEIVEYITAAEKDMLVVAYTDLSAFRENLTMDMLEMVTSYNGADFKVFVEMYLCNSIKKNIQRWVYSYSDHLENQFTDLAKAVAAILTDKFGQDVVVENHYLIKRDQDILQKDIAVNVKDVSKISMHAGFVSAGIAGALALTGANMVLPFISMAAMPTLHQKLLEGKLKEVKSTVRPELTTAIDRGVEQLYAEISHNIATRIEQLKTSAIKQHAKLLKTYKTECDVNLKQNATARMELEKDIQILTYKLSQLEVI